MASAAPAAVAAAAGAAVGDDVPRVGLSLAALRAFVRVRGKEYELSRGPGAAERVPFEQLTTKQLCDACVKPLTRDGPGGSRSYAELLQAQNERDARGRPFVAPATLFVSHAWSYRFADIVSALEAHHEAQPYADRQYFWLDLFVVNQHRTLASEWWSGAFSEAIASIGNTLLVLQPWSQPQPLSRSWCLWEIFSSIKSDVKLTVVMSPTEQAAFNDALLHRFDDISLALAKISTEKADAQDEADKLRIANVIRGSRGGFRAVDQRIHERLREWLTNAARQRLAVARKAAAHQPAVLTFTSHLARLLLNQGQVAESVALLREVVEARRRQLVAADSDSVCALVDAVNELGGALCDGASDWTAAEALFAEALRLSRGTLGAEHDATLSSLTNLARVQGEQGNSAEAEAMLRNALRMHRARFGDGHAKTMACANQLADVLKDQGQLREAEQLFMETERGRKLALGDTHPDTLASTIGLANVHVALGHPKRAAKLYHSVLPLLRVQCGDVHPSTLVCSMNLALALGEVGDVAAALPLMTEALAGYRDTLGDANPDTLSAMMNMGILLDRARRPEEAAPFYRDALRLKRAALGDAHPDTLQSMSNVAAFLGNQGALDEAEPLLAEAVEGYRVLSERTGGAETLTLLSCTLNLAVMRKLRSDWPGAEVAFGETLRLARNMPGEMAEAWARRATNELAGVLLRQRRRDDAQALLADALRLQRAAHGGAHSATLAAADALSTLLIAMRKLPEAVTLWREVLDACRAARGDGAAATATAAQHLATCLRKQGSAAEAAELELTFAAAFAQLQLAAEE